MTDERPDTVTFPETKSTVGITQAGDPPVVQTTPETTFVVGEDNLLTPKDQVEDQPDVEVETSDFEPEPQKENPEAGLEEHSALVSAEDTAALAHHHQGAVGVTDDLKIINARAGYPIDEPAMGPQEPAVDEVAPSEEAAQAGLLEESGHEVGEELTAEDEQALDELDDDDEAIPDPGTSDKPTEENTVPEIKAYLDTQGTAYTSTLTKAELLELV